MAKLNPAKIRWIIKEMEKGEIPVKHIAAIQNVTKARIYQLHNEYQETGEIPQLGTPGRPKETITKQEKHAIQQAHDKYQVNATYPKPLLEKEYNTNLSTRKIHRNMKTMNKAQENPNKQRKRKWVRYERTHANDLWHTDWCQINKNWFIAYQDDASRHILAWDLYENATSQNAVQTLHTALHEHGTPNDLLTDPGAQFYHTPGEGKEQGKTQFQQTLEQNGINHIVGRPNHPQTNGKIERLFQTLQNKLDQFESMHECIHWYNNLKPHKSLRLNEAETPQEAFYRKLPPTHLTRIWSENR
jgi:putative transposase